MTEEERRFAAENSAVWAGLESETAYFRKHLKRSRGKASGSAPDKERIDRYMDLYRRTANHLAYARTFFGENTETAEYLNRIEGEAHAVIYAGRSSAVKKFFRFIGKGFPRLFRSEIRLFILTALVLIIPGLTAYFVVRADARNALLYFDARTLENLRPEGQYDEVSLVFNTIDGFYIGENNITVCLEAFAGGLTLGIFTVYMLIQNGLIIGALAAYCELKGTGVFFWSLILPHGITEFFAIFLSGMAGFALARGIIKPGRISRRTALVKEGRTSLKLILMSILFLLFSAAVESWFTPLDLPYAVKYIFAGAVLLLLTVYLCSGLRAGRKVRKDPRG